MATTNASKKEIALGQKIMSSKKMKPSDFKFKWIVSSDFYRDDEALKNDPEALNAFNELDKAKTDEQRTIWARKLVEIEAKYKKPYRYYTLRRIDETNVCAALCTVLKYGTKKYQDAMKNNENIKLYRDVLKLEEKKNRTFCSLSAMQRWVDKHNLRIDVYSLWNSKKNSK